MIATHMSIIRGIVAKRERNPMNRNKGNTISTTPINGAKKSGYGIPIFVNLPMPNCSGNRNFCIPSVKKTIPTINLIIIMAAGDFVFMSLFCILGYFRILQNVYQRPTIS